jgi:uncharacterized protein Yka (UPF0111/DUF47 family)
VSRQAWIITLVAVGVGAAIVLGIIGSRGGDESQAQAQQNFCSSLSALDSSVTSLTSLDPSTASKDDYQSDVSQIESDWDQVKSDAQDLKNITTSELDSSWDSFKSAVDNVPSDASVSDALQAVSQSAETLVSTTKSTLTGPDCSS